MPEPKALLIICPLVFLAGFVDAIAGGGGLISLPAYLLAGLPPYQAIATNKMSSTMGTTASTLRYLKNGYVDWQAALPCMFAGALAHVKGTTEFCADMIDSLFPFGGAILRNSKIEMH